MADISVPVSLAAVPLLGYPVLYGAYFTRFRYYRVTGQRLFFVASGTGVVVLFLGRLASFLYSALYGEICFECCTCWLPEPQRLKEWVYGFAPFAGSDTLLWSIGAGILLVLTANLVMGKTRSAIAAATWYGDLIEMRLQNCMQDPKDPDRQEEKLAEVSLSSRKSYIGFVLNSGVASIGDTEIAILPVASGYRDVDTQELIITTHYGDLEARARKYRVNVSDFQVVITKSEIMTVRVFVPEAYLSLLPADDPEPLDAAPT